MEPTQGLVCAIKDDASYHKSLFQMICGFKKGGNDRVPRSWGALGLMANGDHEDQRVTAKLSVTDPSLSPPVHFQRPSLRTALP